MNHDAAVLFGPTRAVRQLFAHKTIFDTQQIMGEGGFVEKMAKAILERALITLVPHLEQAVFHTKGVCEVLAGRIPLDFRNPTVEILPLNRLTQPSSAVAQNARERITVKSTDSVFVMVFILLFRVSERSGYFTGTSRIACPPFSARSAVIVSAEVTSRVTQVTLVRSLPSGAPSQ